MNHIRAISVDYDKQMLFELDEMARESGIEMYCFDNSVDAIKFVERNDIDIAFIDDVMPVINSSNLVDHIRTFHSNIPIVILASPDDSVFEQKNQGKKKNIIFISKPLKSEDFNLSLSNLLKH